VTRVLLVDDHAAFRQPLAFMLNREPDIQVVGDAGSVAEARPFLHQADVVVLDLDLEDEAGVNLIGELRNVNPRAHAVVLTATRNQQELARAVEAGAVGILHKSVGIVDIVEGIRRVSQGEYLISSAEAIELLRVATRHREATRAAQTALGRLTPRERDVLQCLTEGVSDREIAEHLGLSTETVRTHMVNILGKLGVESRLQALVFALRHGMVDFK
jgi:RNA polymerase sigma factor (sigma-70 family)